MPTLRFARDKRGYETTSLVHAFRHRGRARQRILYWFRSPPNVKVGRPALDEEAIRWIEEHNPDIEFNWQKILAAQPPPSPVPAEDGKVRRGGRRDGREPRRSGQQSRSAPAQPRPQPIAASAGASEGVDQVAQAVEPVPGPAEAFEQLIRPDAEEQPRETLAPVEAVMGREQLARFRARFAELQARITERGGEPARIEALRAQAESLNPDAWVTEEEARQGLAEFEIRVRDLRNALGLRRRRRSRRGGRKRHQGGQAQTDPQNGASGQEEPGALAADSTLEGAPEAMENMDGPDEPDA